MESRPMITGAFAEEYRLFVEIFSETLRFLEEEWGFSRDIGSVGSFWITMVYIKDDLAIKFEFDVREMSLWGFFCRWSGREELPHERIGMLTLMPELSPRVNSEMDKRTEPIRQLQKRASQRYDRELIREWLRQEAELYAFRLSYGGRDLIIRARERLGLSLEEGG